jgi:hypothetical protein
MNGSDCFRNTRPCTYGDCHRGAAYVMYAYHGAYRWATDKQYACPDHVEQLALCHGVTASDIHPYDDSVPL